MYFKVPTYIINLKKRRDRKKYILQEFRGKDEFNIHLIEAFQHKIGAIGLWNTITHILKNDSQENSFIIICEDDHQFTNAYSKELLFSCIAEAGEKQADILSGGVSGFTSTLQVSKRLFWVEKFSGSQFIIIFRKFFKEIIEADFGPGDAADYKICSLTDYKFFIYPFISVQKDFGYSDATPKNNVKGHVEEIFNQSEAKIQMLKRVSAFYQNKRISENNYEDAHSWENITIPTYIINLSERQDRRKHIEKQFQGKNEFDIKIIEACKHKIGAVGLWLSIRKIIELAIKNEDDVIIICEDDHEFTDFYSKEYLLKNIIEAHERCMDLLSGGTAYFDTVLPITNDLFWANGYNSTQFMVIYRKFFQKIMEEPYDDEVAADGLFSMMTANKTLLYPFISLQKDFGYSDCTSLNNQVRGLVENYFLESTTRLSTIKEMYSKYQ